ncbi:MAG: hypothetical protein IKN71_04815 [Alphaproteobacteria bacterium]|nr:hypothetical protein [Alphaproteobacteria bacterium]
MIWFLAAVNSRIDASCQKDAAERYKAELDKLKKLLNGHYKRFYDSGKVAEEFDCDEAKLVGKYKAYYENEQTKIEAEFKDGKMEGKYKEYYENGNLKEEGEYQDGEKNGIWKTYSEKNEVSIQKFREGEDLTDLYNKMKKVAARRIEDEKLMEDEILHTTGRKTRVTNKKMNIFKKFYNLYIK